MAATRPIWKTRSAPTRIARYDLANNECLEEIDLEPAGLNTVFSIHAA